MAEADGVVAVGIGVAGWIVGSADVADVVIVAG
jgi:hypothetical protein